jgi:UDP-3-O-[3-hydroxymyristoyl] glucosamine N-acyltransferase LpxD
MDLGEVSEFIRINGYLPKDVSYTTDIVQVGAFSFPTDRPRLWFARVLGLWETNEQGSTDNRGNTLTLCVQNGIDCIMGANCVIGGPGFGYEYDEQGHLIPIPHHGRVVIGNNVTLHNQVNIDRGVIGDTVIGDGTKIDSLVHIAHNVKIGKHCLIVSGSVFGGSCEIGDYTFIGMNACIKQKVKVGRNCVIGAGAVVTKDVPDNTIYVGNPAKYLKMTEQREYPV